MKQFLLTILLSVFACTTMAQSTLNEAYIIGNPTDIGIDHMAARLDCDGDWCVMSQGLSGFQAWVFRRVDGVWQYSQNLNPWAGGDNFGRSVAIDGDFIVVGTSGDDNPLDAEGAVYVYRREGTTWVQDHKLFRSSDDIATGLGTSVDIDGNRLAAGYPGGQIALQEGVVIYEYDGDEWVETQDISLDFDTTNFGVNLALDGDRLVIAATSDYETGSNFGATYFYELVDDVWTMRQKIFHEEGEPVAMGLTIDLEGDRLVVGSGSSDDAAGHLSYYTFEDSIFVHQQLLSAPIGGGEERFASDAVLAGDSLLVGSPSWVGEEDLENQGRGYLYTADDEGMWSLSAFLEASEPQSFDVLGIQTVIGEEDIILSALGHDYLEPYDDMGALFIFPFQPSGLEDSPLQLIPVTLYPNPSDGILRVELEEFTKPATYRIFDTRGKQMGTGSISEMNPLIDLRTLPSGSYLIELSDENQRGYSRVIIHE